MKRLLTIAIAIILLTTATQAQTTEKKTLETNMQSTDELTKLLNNDYTQIMSMNTVLPKATYVVNDLVCISPYGDAGANAQTKQIETELKSFLNASKWSFGPNTYERPEFGVMGKLQIVAKSKTETLDYSSSGALFKPQGLIDGLDVQIAVYQNKKNPKSFIFLFPVSTICSAVMEVVKQ
jgi:hypothetical protein